MGNGCPSALKKYHAKWRETRYSPNCQRRAKVIFFLERFILSPDALRNTQSASVEDLF